MHELFCSNGTCFPHFLNSMEMLFTASVPKAGTVMLVCFMNSDFIGSNGKCCIVWLNDFSYTKKTGKGGVPARGVVYHVHTISPHISAFFFFLLPLTFARQ